MKNKKLMIVILLNVIAVGMVIIMSLFVKKNVSTFTVNILFVVFTLLPMALVILFPFISMLVYSDKKTMFINYMFSFFVYIYNFFVIDSFFTTDVIETIYNNSNLEKSSVTVTSSTNIGSMISTIIAILALCSIASFFASFIVRKRKLATAKKVET